MKATNGTEIMRMDFVENTKGYLFLVTKQDDGLNLWDFKAWLEGYYDAYIPLDTVTEPLKIIGNIWNRPELLPKACRGYNGEPNCVRLETIWVNPKIKTWYCPSDCQWLSQDGCSIDDKMSNPKGDLTFENDPKYPICWRYMKPLEIKRVSCHTKVKR